MNEQESNVPDVNVIDRIIEYSEICLNDHPDSVKARQFFEDHKHLPKFEVNAIQHYQMIKDDLYELEQKFGKNIQRPDENISS
ncbi:hypothetical protein [Gimesia fumaroli]|nr:hypothetical protein [Gimesia fumaroli]